MAKLNGWLPGCQQDVKRGNLYEEMNNVISQTIQAGKRVESIMDSLLDHSLGCWLYHGF